MQDPNRTTVQRVQKLIRELKGMGLEAARSIAYEELRALPMSPHLIESILRRVGEQQSVEGLLETLESFAASLSSGPTPSASCHDSDTTLPCIAARKVGLECEKLYTAIYPEEVLYIFSQRAVADCLIEASWIQPGVFDSQYVYLRTSTGVFVTSFRSLAQLWNHLNRRCFVLLHRSLWINRQKIAELDDSEEKRKRVSVALSNGAREWLTASRRPFQTLLRQIGRHSSTTMREDCDAL